MPKNRLEKRITEYEKLAATYAHKNGRSDDAKRLKNIGIASRALNNKLNELKGNGEPEQQKNLSADDIDSLLTLYGNLVNAVKEYTKPYADRYRELETLEDFTSAQSKEFFKIKETILPPFDKLNRALSKDISALKKAKDKENISLNEVFEKSKTTVTHTATRDSGGVEVGAQNERIKVTLKDSENNEIKGYFTPDSSSTLDDDKLMRNAFEKVKKKYGKSASFLTYKMVEQFCDSLPVLDKSLLVGEDSYYLFQNSYNDIIDYYGSDPEDPEDVRDFDLRKVIKSPEQLHIFLEAASAYMTEYNRTNIGNETVGITNEVRANRRNAAMSDMADMLGRPDLIASAENVKINLDGKEVKGTFMKNASGSDIKKLELDSDLLKLTTKSLENLSLKKSIADLQVIDFICGNPDRSSLNMFYNLEKDEQGNVILKSVQGIDNDSSLGSLDVNKNTSLHPISPENMRVITREMADKVLSLDTDQIRQLYGKYDLTTTQLDALTDRVKQLQNSIREGEEFYKKGYAKGTLVPGKIKIVDDDELNILSFNRDLGDSKHNHYNRVISVVASANAERVKKNMLSGYGKNVKALTCDNYDKAQKVMDDISSVDKFYHTGSPEYTLMREKTESCLKGMRSFVGPFFNENSNGISDNLAELKTRFTEAKQACEDYKTYKSGRNTREGLNALDQNPNHKLSRREKRWVAVDNNIKFLDEQLKIISKLEQQAQRYGELAPTIQQTQNNYLDFKNNAQDEIIDGIKAQRRLNEINNTISRSNYLIKEAADAIKNERQAGNVAAATARTLDFNIYLGFAAYGFPEKEGNELIKNAENALGKKITEDKETLFKRAVASLLVKTKVELAAKPQKDLSRYDQQMIKQLKDLPLSEGPDCIDNIMKSDTFKAFMDNVGPKYAPENDKSWESNSTRNCLANIGMSETLGQYKRSGLAEAYGKASAKLQKEANLQKNQVIKN